MGGNPKPFTTSSETQRISTCFAPRDISALTAHQTTRVSRVVGAAVGAAVRQTGPASAAGGRNDAHRLTRGDCHADSANPAPGHGTTRGPRRPCDRSFGTNRLPRTGRGTAPVGLNGREPDGHLTGIWRFKID